MINNPATEAVKGQILWSDKNKNVKTKKGGYIPPHYIVYLEPHDANHFMGAMITTSKAHGNIPMDSSHFVTPDKANGYTVGFKNSYVVNKRLLKLHQWAPFKPVGMLSPAGIKFIDDNIGGTAPEVFMFNAP